MNRIVKLVRYIIAWFRVPRGMYCYVVYEEIHNFSGTYPHKYKVCPYWRKIKNRSHQEDGWCDYLGKGDIEIKSEDDWKIVYSKKSEEIGSSVEGVSLLWDQCKECGIKMEEEDD